MTAARLWPVAIVGVLAVTVAANVVLIVRAGDPDAAGIEPDYYARALAWDSTMAQARQNQALGWRLDAELGAATAAGTPLTVRLAGPGGAPLAGAVVEVEAIHNLAASHPLRARLAPAAGGGYAVTLPLAHRGLWELRFTVEWRGERFTADLRRDAAGAGR